MRQTNQTAKLRPTKAYHLKNNRNLWNYRLPCTWTKEHADSVRHCFRSETTLTLRVTFWLLWWKYLGADYIIMLHFFPSPCYGEWVDSIPFFYSAIFRPFRPISAYAWTAASYQWEGEYDGGVLLCGDGAQSLQVAQLQAGWRLCDHQRCLLQGAGGVHLSLCRDHLQTGNTLPTMQPNIPGPEQPLLLSLSTSLNNKATIVCVFN